MKKRFLLCLLLASVFCGHLLHAAEVDIRANHKIAENSSKVSYSLLIDNCQLLSRVEYNSSSETQVLDSSSAVINPNSMQGCQFVVEDGSATRFNPSFTLFFSDNTTSTYSENFIAEDIQPTISFEQVAISSNGNQQFLHTKVQANDDQDISYVAYSVVAIRASDLTAAGGVIEQAKSKAFAKTEQVTRVYPSSDNQTEFNLTLPLNKILSAQAIARDSLVLADISKC